MADDNPPDGRAGKPMKYMRYAIGEIALVVIGILIAVQINTWNKQRIDRTKEQVLIKQLKEDYNPNLLQLDGKIEMRKTIIRSAQRNYL